MLDCAFVSCRAPDGNYGGVSARGQQNALIQGCDFIECSAKHTAGCKGGFLSPVRDCRFIGCSGESWSAAVAFDFQVISNCLFAANQGAFGCIVGGQDVQYGDVGDIVDCVITNNGTRALFGRFNARNGLIANNSHGVNLYYPGDSTFENCTIANNGSGFTSIHTDQQQELNLVNTIVYENEGGDWSFQDNVSVIANNSIFAGNHAGEAKRTFVACHFGRRPGFNDANNGDFTLRSAAFARDKGVVLPWMTVGSADLAGGARLVNSSGTAFAADALPDIGCYENQNSVPGLTVVIR